MRMKNDPVHRPRHYDGDGNIDCKAALHAMLCGYNSTKDISPDMCYWMGCALKYIWRMPNKGGVQDIDKAIECLNNAKHAVFEDRELEGQDA